MATTPKCPILLVKDRIITNNDVGDAISNVKQLITEYQNYLEIKNIFNYDRLDIPGTPCTSIVFRSAVPQVRGLGSACNAMIVKLFIYLYFETLTPGMDTYSHVTRLSEMVRMFYDHNSLYGLCAGEKMTVENSELIGRTLGTVYLVGQIDLTVPVRFCVCRECVE